MQRSVACAVLIALTLAFTGGLSYRTQAQARLYTFNDSLLRTHKYVLLNGEKLALYLNDRGDLGAPYYFDQPVKPAGYLLGGLPDILEDGSVAQSIADPSVLGNTFAALYSAVPVNTTLSLGAQVRAKNEYISLGGLGTTEQYGIRLNGNWLYGSSLVAATGGNPIGLTASGSNPLAPLKAISTLKLPVPGGTLVLKQTVILQNTPANKNIAQFVISFTNSSPNTLSSLQYARLVNPNQGAASPLSTLATTQSLLTPADPNAFAIDAASGTHHLGLGISLGTSGVPASNSVPFSGTTLLALPPDVNDELSFFSNLDGLVATTDRVVLNNGFTATAVDGLTGAIMTTSDFRTDANFQPTFAQNDASLALVSAPFDLGAQRTLTFSFNYYFDPPAASSGRFDFNGDGHADILLRYIGASVNGGIQTGDLYVWFMNGQTPLSILGYMQLLPSVSLDWQVAGCPDFDQDGQTDILWQNANSGDVAIWYMNGTTLLYGQTLATGVQGWKLVGTADLNGDHQLDLLWQNATTGEVTYWLMSGTTLIGSGSFGLPLPGASIVAVCNLNGNSKPDVILQNTITGDITYREITGVTAGNSGSGTWSNPILIAPGIPLEWQIVGSPDLDGDGIPDLLWQNVLTGDVAAWLMTKTATVKNATTIANVGVNAWNLAKLH